VSVKKAVHQTRGDNMSLVYYFFGTQCTLFCLEHGLLLGMVDTIFADVAQPDQARIVAINAHHFLRNEGHVVISIKVCFVAEFNGIKLYIRCL